MTRLPAWSTKDRWWIWGFLDFSKAKVTFWKNVQQTAKYAHNMIGEELAQILVVKGIISDW